MVPSKELVRQVSTVIKPLVLEDQLVPEGAIVRVAAPAGRCEAPSQGLGLIDHLQSMIHALRHTARG